MANLPIPDEPTYVSFAVTSSSTGPFPITFSLFAKADLRVSVGGVELDQNDFTFTGTAIDSGYDGGSITLNDAVENTDVLIWRDITPARTTDFAPATTVPVKSIDAALDRQMAIAQDQTRDIERGVLMPLGEDGIAIPSPADRADTILIFDEDGAPAFLPYDNFSVDPANAMAKDFSNATANLPIENGGTDASSAPEALANLGGASASDLADLTVMVNTLSVTGLPAYASTAAGLAGTTNGQYFQVLQPVGSARSSIPYLNSAGSAVAQESPASYTYVNSLLTPLNGTADRWYDTIIAAGGAVSATALAALRKAEYQLHVSGLLPKIVRLNLGLASNAQAARTPFYARSGCGFATDTGTMASWSEAAGFTGYTLDTGVTLQQGGLGGYNLGLGVYLPVTPVVDSGQMLGGASGWGFTPWSGSTAYATANMITFDFFGRIIRNINRNVGGGGPATDIYDSAGWMFGCRPPSGEGYIAQNGMRLTSAGSTVKPPEDTLVIPTDTIVFKTTSMSAGAYAITEGLTPSEQCVLFWIIHETQVAIARGAVAEGL